MVHGDCTPLARHLRVECIYLTCVVVSFPCLMILGPCTANARDVGQRAEGTACDSLENWLYRCLFLQLRVRGTLGRCRASDATLYYTCNYVC